MVRTITTLVGGIFLGALAMLAVNHGGPLENLPGREIIRDIISVPEMSQEIAEQHRVEHYARFDTIQQVVALPTEFDRSAALYSLAGRSDSATLQRLIFEADRVADDTMREGLLDILFSRLAEKDPESALALANIDRFKGGKAIAQVVWRSWGRNDLASAMTAANSLTSASQKKLAAQYIFAAFGFLGNDTTDRIEAEVGVKPDRATRRNYLYSLADRSPAIAIEFINNLESRDSRLRNTNWLSQYLALRDPAMALSYANQFRVLAEGNHYSNVISGTMAYDNPRDTIERLLANGNTNLRNGEYHSAMRALVATDIDAALQYFEQAQSNEHRQWWGSLIALELVAEQPAEALRWARENDSGPYSQIQMTVINKIAETDPGLALSEAQSFSNIDRRASMVSAVIGTIARNDPTNAAAFLEQIKDRNQKTQASQQLIYSWVRQDQDAAIDWLLSRDKQTLAQMIGRVGRNLVEYNIEAAIRLLPKLDNENGLNLQQQIARRLATNRSADEAQIFIEQFSGQAGYDQMQAALIAGVAQSDAVAAKQLAAQIANGDARDVAYVQVISEHAKANPAEAAQWLSNIVDEGRRAAAAGQLASNWYARDPVAAMRWTRNLPAGQLRDEAIVHLSYRWGEPTADTERLIGSIKDRNKRGQATVRQIYGLIRTNPSKARALLEDSDIPDHLRSQAETALSRSDLGF